MSLHIKGMTQYLRMQTIYKMEKNIFVEFLWESTYLGAKKYTF